MNSAIPHIIEELRSQLVPLEEQETRLRADLAELKDQKQKLESALVALGGGPAKARPAKRGKPCITRRDVTAALMELVRDNAPVSKVELEALVRERLAAEGERSLSGFSLRFREALHEPAFRCSADGLVTLEKSHVPQEVA